MKKTISIILVFALLILSSVYVNAEQDIKNITIVSGIGIDYDKETDSYILTVEIFDVNESVGEASAQGNMTKVMQYRGKTISSAVEKMSIELGKTVVYSQKKAIVLGKSVFQKGFMNVVDFFVRDYKTRSGVLVAVAKDGTAEEMIRVNEGGSAFPSEEIETLLESGKNNGFTTEMDMAQLTNMYTDKCTSEYIPLLSKKTEGKDEYTCLSGFAVVNNERYVGDLDLTEGRSLLFVNDKFESGTLNIENEQLGLLTFKIVESKTDVKTYIRNGKPVFFVKIRVTADLVEQQEAPEKRFDKDHVEKVTKIVSEYMKNDIDKTISKCLTEYNSDVFGFGRRVYVIYPDYFKAHEKYFPGNIDGNSVKVDVHFNLRRIGQGNS